MIRYAITARDLNARIDAHSASWRERAEARTASLVAAGRYDEGTSIWSEVKAVFMDVQFNKCIFCERQFEGEEFGRIEHDLEHFRPKSSVKRWPTGRRAGLFDFPLGSPNTKGYFWLAYDLGNYAASCKVCNSTLKSNAFPIAGHRGIPVENGRSLLNKEKPYLCYPIGRVDKDPEDILDFVGTVAVPRGRRGHKRRRAEVVIEFFKLNDRDQLHFERASELTLLGFALRKREADPDTERWSDFVEALIADSRSHAACKRAFMRRWSEERELAERLLHAAEEVLLTRSVPTP